MLGDVLLVIHLVDVVVVQVRLLRVLFVDETTDRLLATRQRVAMTRHVLLLLLEVRVELAGVRGSLVSCIVVLLVLWGVLLALAESAHAAVLGDAAHGPPAEGVYGGVLVQVLVGGCVLRDGVQGDS